MAKDPAFLFYPGDYLRDTQCLSEKSQVAYDRIMCEHMRNISISQERIDFFTKRLNEDEKYEIMSTLVKIDGGFHIEWVSESIMKRRAYSDSRRKNRSSKPKEDMINTSSTYDEHMENENDNEDKVKNKLLIDNVFNHYFKTFSKTSSYKLTQQRKNLIAKKLKDYSEDELKTAITNMSNDDWEDRPKFSDLTNAIGTLRGVDQVSKWLEFKSTKKITGAEKAGVKTLRKEDFNGTPTKFI